MFFVSMWIWKKRIMWRYFKKRDSVPGGIAGPPFLQKMAEINAPDTVELCGGLS
jgi:hypothetical protein